MNANANHMTITLSRDYVFSVLPIDSRSQP